MSEAKQSAIAWSVLVACGLLLAAIYLLVSLGCKTSGGRGIEVTPPEHADIVNVALQVAYSELEAVGAPVVMPGNLRVMFVAPTLRMPSGEYGVMYNGGPVGGYTIGKMAVSVLDGDGNVQFELLKKEVAHSVCRGNEAADYAWFRKAGWLK